MSSYQWLSPRDHVLQRPDTYVGGVSPASFEYDLIRLGDDGVLRCKKESVFASPALLKVSDEVITNAIDNHRRDPSQKTIRISFKEDGVFEVFNDGKTIPIRTFEKTNRYLPEILFGELMSGENFDDTISRSGGGRNGFGVKVANILALWFEVSILNKEENQIFYSTEDAKGGLLSVKHDDQAAAKAIFENGVDTVRKNGLVFWIEGSSGCEDGELGRLCTPQTLVKKGSSVYKNVGPLKYVQRFDDNLGTIHPPVLTLPTAKEKSFTQVRWKVDLARLNMPSPLSPTILGALRSRAYDAAVCTSSRVTILLEGEKIEIKSLRAYATAVGGSVLDVDAASGQFSSMETCFFLLPTEDPCIIAFVNGVRCCLGTHIDWVYRSACEAVSEVVSKRLKKQVTISVSMLRKKVGVVMRFILENPTFTSQSKEKLDLRADKFQMKYVCSPALRRSFEKSTLLDAICDDIRQQESKTVQKTLKVERSKVVNVPKYEKALKLHGKEDCSLFVTEGDSAKSLAVAGFSVIGRETNGVFPLRGKLPNVRGMTIERGLQNKEILSMTKILGLDPRACYTAETVKKLPYKTLVIFTDQDHDGSHIMGLLINWLLSFHPSLLTARPDFVKRFATPIIRAKLSPGGEMASFFSEVEYRAWIGDRTPNFLKYYKGLGTSDADDAKVYFSNFDRHIISVMFTGQKCSEATELFFATSKADARKEVLKSVDDGIGTYIDYALEQTSVSEFCFKDLIQFSAADNVRSLANAVDGLKPSQRKVLFSCLHRKQGEVKVAQLAASTAELTAYHHGESSLVQTIVSMAQNWIGTNNVAILKPNGMFGSRHNPRTEHSAERYIFTERHPIARLLFRPEDDALLQSNFDDGRKIEPFLYVPIVPFLLFNGSDGIGTGWRSSCPAFNPMEVVECVRRLIDGESMGDLVPYNTQFKGKTDFDGVDSTYTGLFEVDPEHRAIIITELAPKVWTSQYVEWIRETFVGDGARCFVLEVEDASTYDMVHIRLKVKASFLEQESSLNTIEKELKLTHRARNHLNFFDAKGKLASFSSLRDIVDAHFVCRKALYAKRIEEEINTAIHDEKIASNKCRFVLEILEETLIPKLFSSTELVVELRKRGYYEHDSFRYLRMDIFTLTRDLVAKLKEQQRAAAEKIKELQKLTIASLWKKELDELKKGLEDYERDITLKRESRNKKRQEKRGFKGEKGERGEKKAKKTKKETQKD